MVVFGFFLTLEASYALAALSACAMAAAETALYLGWHGVVNQGWLARIYRQS